MDPIGLTTSLHRALEAGESGPALRRHFTADAITVERPNLIKPHGARSSIDEMIANSEEGAGLLSSQKYDLHSALVSGSTAILRLTWTGMLRDGKQLVAHIAQFVDTRDGLISAIETFDCYEPF
ncbi:nuclear transport factor 2 family protein [Lentzea sp. NPDC051208]|uniref:nuclear transport factor 2 family protein n=1 Tax=Lentzea sp. NPDC051208 TaxID=3154642 RepID=UPI003444ED2B